MSSLLTQAQTAVMHDDVYALYKVLDGVNVREQGIGLLRSSMDFKSFQCFELLLQRAPIKGEEASLALHAAGCGFTQAFQVFVDHLSRKELEACLIVAVGQNHSDILKALSGRVDLSCLVGHVLDKIFASPSHIRALWNDILPLLEDKWSSSCMHMVLRGGSTEALKLVLQHPLNEATLGVAAGGAVLMDNLEWLLLLEKRLSPNQKQFLFEQAAGSGNLRCLSHLMAFANPKSKSSSALQLAVLNNQFQAMEMLIPVSNVDAAYIKIKRHFKKSAPNMFGQTELPPAFHVLDEMMRARQQKTVLTRVVGEAAPSSGKRKI